MSLICTAKKCEFGGSITGDSYLSCWLCNNCSHIKCAGGGHNGRISDLITKNIGLTWSCIACREIESEMRTFMKQTRNGFLDVRKQFAALNEQFLTLETQFLGLKLLSESPRRKIPNNNPMAVNLLGTPASHVIHSDKFLTPNTSSPPIVPVEVIHSPSLPMESSMSLVPPIVLDPPSLENLQVPVAPSPRPLTGVAPELKSSGLSLRAVAPRKAIFVSRLMPDATVDDVRSHLLKHLKVAPNDLAVFKFNFKHKRNISSFKIVIPESYFEKALDPSAWPEHSIIHEFLAKDPLNHNFADSAPKN
ncbi:hypothetical protein KR067_009452 [Drosophila pandora]|nr:hypothetical protein KR067_009452 [Drosophila pandora]